MRRFLLPVCLIVTAALCGAAFPTLSHAQIPIADARSQGVGATVTVEGTVSRAFGDFVRFQDASGPTGASGLVVRQTSGDFFDDVQDGTITEGTQLQVTGTLSEFNGLLQINEGDLSSYSVQGQGAVPSAQSVSLADLAAAGEDYESELVSVSGLSFEDAQGTFQNSTSYPVSDGSAALTFRVQTASETELAGTPIPEGGFNYTGVIGEFNTSYQLIPVHPSDLDVPASFRFNRILARAVEGSGTVQVNVEALGTDGASVSVTARVGSASTATNGTDVTGFSAPQTLTFSGSNPAPQTLSFGVASDTETEGVERLEVVLDPSDGTTAQPSRFTLWILDDATAQAPIAPGDSGSALRSQLQTRFGDAPTLGLDRARDTLYAAAYNDGGTVEGVYSGFQVSVDPNADDPSGVAGSQGMNAEHLWPQSKGSGEEPAVSDLHILAPTRDAVNSARSNYAYGEIVDTDADQWFFEDQSQSAPPSSNRPAWSEVDSSPSDRDDRRFEPRHSVKGDVARAAFYFATLYPSRADLSFFEAQRSTLLSWHEQDPVDAAEMQRTLLQASYQGNALNPFVVDSTLADRAFGADAPVNDVMTIAEARNEPLGTDVAVEAVVTRVDDDTPYVQDSTAGIAVFDDAVASAVSVGDSVRVEGTLDVFAGLLEIVDVGGDGVTVLASDQPLPTPQPRTLSEIESNGEALEAELVEVDNLTFDAAGGTFSGGTNYTISDGSGGSVELRVPGGSFFVGTTIPSDPVTFSGVLGQFNGEFDSILPNEGYQLLALQEGDLSGIGGPPPPEEVTIAEARQSEGQAVTIEGTVTRAFGSYARIQDDSGPTGASGIVIRQTGGANAEAFQQDISDGTIQRGTTLRLTGTISSFAGLVQVNNENLDSYSVEGQGPPRSAQNVGLSDLSAPGGEDFESELIRVDGLSFPDSSAGGTFAEGTTYTVVDSSGATFELRVQGGDETNIIDEPIPSDTVAFEGVLGQFDGFTGNDEGYQLLPVQPTDLQSGDDGEPTTIADARTVDFGTLVTVEGTVTRAFGSYVRLQDTSGVTGASALVVRQTDGPNATAFQDDIADGTIQRGTRLRITGVASAFAGLVQVNNEDLDSYTVVDSGAPPAPQAVTLADIEAPDGEDRESELIRVEGLSFPNASGSFEAGTTYTVEDSSGTAFDLRVQGGSESNVIGEPIPEGPFAFQGVLGQFDNFTGNDEGYQLIPIQPGDLEPTDGGGGLTSIAAARTTAFDSLVTVEGTVTRAFGSYARIQDTSGVTGASALVIRQTSGANADAFQQDITDGTIQQGTRLRVTGRTSQFSGLIQFNNDNLDSYSVEGQGALPPVQGATLGDLQAPFGEALESELIRVEGLTFSEASGTFAEGTTYVVENADGTSFEFRVQSGSETNVIGEPIPSGPFDFQGVLGQFNGFGGRTDSTGYQLLPVQPSDVQDGPSTCPLSWSLAIAGTDDVGTDTTLTIGQGPNATAGLDPACGEEELPPVPPSGAFDLRLTDTNLPGVDLGEGSVTDIRPDDTATGEPATNATSAPAVWRIDVQSDDDPVTFTWDAAALADSIPDAPVQLVDAATGGDLVDVNMKTTGTATIENTNVTALEVRLDQQITRTVPLVDGWSLTSIPLVADDPSFSALLPNCESAFVFDDGYTAIGDNEAILPGTGFFANCSGGNAEVTGTAPDSTTLAVPGGWTILGPFADSVAVSTITSEPSGIIETSFFGFDQGYDVAETLRPGRGYWVKTSQAGVLDLSGSSATGAGARPLATAKRASDGGARLTLTDATGRSTTLRFLPDGAAAQLDRYAMPPRPPRSLFDVRFATGRSAVAMGAAASGEAASLHDVTMQGLAFPVTLRLNGASSTTLRVQGAGSQAVTLSADAPTTTLRTPTTTLRVGDASAPSAFALQKSVPNPATQRASLRYAVPERADVSIVMYDVLGRRVAHLVDDVRPAGRHEVQIGPRVLSALPSGTYFVRMQADDFTQTRRLTVVR